MKLNLIGLISAILAFISIVLPWYSITGIYNEHASLLTIVSTIGTYGGAAAGVLWFIWVALALIIIGALLGLVGSLVIGGRGKSLLTVGGILVILSPIIFAIGWVTSPLGSVLPLFGSWTIYNYTLTVFASFGFFLAFVAAILMLISTRKHPMETGAVAPGTPPPP